MALTTFGEFLGWLKKKDQLSKIEFLTNKEVIGDDFTSNVILLVDEIYFNYKVQ